MAEEDEPWNKVNIPFPSAASSVRIEATLLEVQNTRLDKKVDNVLRFLRGKLLQTEVRVLYELLFTCQNNHGTNLTFRTLKQVEQSINRLKDMKLDAALLDLAQSCPSQLLRKRIMVGHCQVPSQPMLEWVALKVLGAAQLLTRVMDLCSTAFLRARQQLKHEEFIVLNVVIISMVSRLWLHFRAIRSALVPLYGQIRNLHAKVSLAHPMPFLTGFSLPTNLMEFPKPTSSSLPSEGLKTAGLSKSSRATKRRMLAPSNQTNKHRDDLGVPLQRVKDLDRDQNPPINIFKNVKREPIAPSSSWKSQQGEQKVFLTEVCSAATFRHVATHLKDMVALCGSQKQKREKQYFSFLQLKCRRFEKLEMAGHSLQGKLRHLKAEACWVLSPSDPLPASCHSLRTLWRRAHPKTRFQPLRSRVRTTGAPVKIVARREKQQVRPLESPGKRSQKQGSRTSTGKTSKVSASSDVDEIEDIFSSLDF